MIDYKFFTDFQKELYTEHGYMLDKLNPSNESWHFNKLTDKKEFINTNAHNYYLEYAHRFEKKRNTALKVLEIGVHHGYSLLLWESYFSQAHIYGIDIDLSASFRGDTPKDLLKDKERIHLFEFDAYEKQNVENFIKEEGGNFDIIIEDGSHHPIHQLQALSYFLPHINKEGMFIVEDVIADIDTLLRFKRIFNLSSEAFYLDEYLTTPNKFSFDIDLEILKKFQTEDINPTEYTLMCKDTNLEGKDCLLKMKDVFKLMILTKL